MDSQATSGFAWLSPLGISVALFVLSSLIMGAIGILTPIAIRRLLFVEPHMRGHFLFSPQADAPIFGHPPVELYRQFPHSKTLIETWGAMFSGCLLAFSILQFGVAWFGLRSGYAWALWISVAGNVVALGYYWLLFVLPFASKTSLRFGDLHPFATLPTFIVPVAAVLGWVGLAA